MNELEQVVDADLKALQAPFLVLIQPVLQFHRQSHQALLDGAQRAADLVGDDGGELLAQHLLFAPQGHRLQHQPALFESALDDQPEFIRREGLGQEVVRALLHRVHRRADGGKPGDDDGHDVGVDGADALQHLQAGNARHLQVDEDQIGLRGLHEFQPLRPIRRRGHRKAAAFKDQRAGIQHDLLVVNDEYLIFQSLPLPPPAIGW